MLYLAQVKNNLTSGTTELQLLAYQKSERIWEISNSDLLPIGGENTLSEGLLVLVELDNNRQIVEIKNAKDWVIALIQEYLSCSSITPEFVQQEQARVEEWRQEIATQSLDLTRRYLEVETQREQIQELETSLKQEKEQLELRWKQLQELEAYLKQNENASET
jgi:DNA repair exonuclease SbcCD ATPase subunit